jgi:hypothetical protein
MGRALWAAVAGVVAAVGSALCCAGPLWELRSHGPSCAAPHTGGARCPRDLRGQQRRGALRREEDRSQRNCATACGSNELRSANPSGLRPNERQFHSACV